MEELCGTPMDFFSITNCYARKIFAKCENDADQSDCMKMKDNAQTCMKLLENDVAEVEVTEAAVTLKEDQVSQSADAETEMTEVTDTTADST